MDTPCVCVDVCSLHAHQRIRACAHTHAHATLSVQYRHQFEERRKNSDRCLAIRIAPLILLHYSFKMYTQQHNIMCTITNELKRDVNYIKTK